MKILPKPPRAYAVVVLTFVVHDEDFPTKLRDVLSKHIYLDPALFWLPWPPESLPQVGQEIVSHYLPMPIDGLVIENINYVPSPERVLIEIVPKQEKIPNLDVHMLYCLSGAGFCFFQGKRISEMLAEANFPRSYDEYKALESELA